MKKNSMQLSMLFLVFLSTVSLSKASLIDLDDHLIYDDTTNRIWYNDTNAFLGSWEQSIASLKFLPESFVLNGTSVSLSWSVAFLDDVRTLNFADQSTRDLFKPLSYSTGVSDTPWGVQHVDVWLYYGRVADEGWPGAHSLAYYKVTDFENSGVFVNLKDVTDTWLIDDVDQYPMWVVANVNQVPEPATLLLFCIGMSGLVAYSKKRNNHQ